MSLEGHKRRWRRAWTGVRSATDSRHDNRLSVVLFGANSGHAWHNDQNIVAGPQYAWSLAIAIDEIGDGVDSLGFDAEVPMRRLRLAGR